MQRHNFGGNIQLDPNTAYTPATEQEVLEILDRHHGQRIRCIGRLHSWSRAVECNDVLLDLRHFNQVNPVAEQLADVIDAEREYPLQQFFLVPWRWTYMSQYRRETDRPKSGTSWLYLWYRYLSIDILMLLVVLLVVRVLRINAIIRLMFRQVIPAFVIRDWHVVSPSSLQLVMENELFRHTELELFVQKTNLESAMSFVRQTLCVAAGTANSIDTSFRERLIRPGLEKELNEVSGTYCHHFPICVRKVLQDDTLISMASPADLASKEESPEAWYAITFTSFARSSDREAFEQLGRFLTRSMSTLFAARPHWGKLNYLQPDQLRELYPQFEVFQQLCQSYDPDGHFQNDWTSELASVSRPHETSGLKD